MDQIPPFTVEATLESEWDRRVRSLVEWLRKASDADLDTLWAGAHQPLAAAIEGARVLTLKSERETVVRGLFDDPVFMVRGAFRDLIGGEQTRREYVLASMSADLAGGHRVLVGCGDAPDTFAAYCDPRPPGSFCWEGPDRDTHAEAVEDGRKHHPGHEPEVIEMGR